MAKRIGEEEEEEEEQTAQIKSGNPHLAAGEKRLVWMVIPNSSKPKWGFHGAMGVPNSWMVYFMANPNYKSDWWYTYPSEKYDEVSLMKFPTVFRKNNPVMLQTTN